MRLALLAAVLGCGLCLAETFDYIIVGGGTSGLLLANRLSENPATSVAVIDPGADERGNPLVSDPALFTAPVTSSLANWQYKTVPQTNASDRVLLMSAGKGIGGSSIINGMIYMRGDEAQFDAWEQLGNDGWNWTNLLGYHKKVEKMFTPEAWQVELGASILPENHGFGGGLHVGFDMEPRNRPFYQSVLQSWAKLGQRANVDLNGGSTRGSGVTQQTLDPQLKKRWDAATAFFWPVAGRSNLHLINGTATRVLWHETSGGTKGGDVEAAGIEYIAPDGQRRAVLANREVVLSAGTMRTPLILERSGVGSPRRLREMGIEPVVDLPGVGENLIDQTNVIVAVETKDSYSMVATNLVFATAADIFGTQVDTVAAETRQRLSQWARQAASANPDGPGAAALEHIFRIQHELIFQKNTTLVEFVTMPFQKNLASHANNLVPFSRGSVHISPGNDNTNGTSGLVSDTPAINPRYLAVDFDMAVQVAGGRLASQMWETPPLSDLSTGETLSSIPPPPLAAADEDWRRWIEETVSSNLHPVGTASMMARDLGGVVDPRLVVYGTRGLRVVDASVVPMQMSGHPTATLYAVAQKAAEMMLDDARSIGKRGL